MQFAKNAGNEASIQRLWATSEVWCHLTAGERLAPKKGTLSQLVEDEYRDEDCIVIKQ